MAKIKINVTGHLFTVTEFPLITDNNVNVDEIEAEFDESWDGYAKIAVFKKKSWQNSLCTLFDCNNIAKLPDTVGSGKLILGIVGIDSESQITTNIKTISIAESAEFDGIEAPEEDVYRQILDSYARVINQRSEIDAEIHRVEAQANANYETVNERVNNLVATDPGSTGDNAELLDIRVGSDGKTYPTAGDAVRVQVSELKSDLINIQNATGYVDTVVNVPIVWEQGSFAYSGTTFTLGDSKAYARSNSKLSLESGTIIHIDVADGFIARVDAFAELDITNGTCSNLRNNSGYVSGYGNTYTVMDGITELMFRGCLEDKATPCSYAEIANAIKIYTVVDGVKQPIERITILETDNTSNKERIAMFEDSLQNPLYCTIGIFNSIGAIGDSYTQGAVYNESGSWVGNATNQTFIVTMAKRAGVQTVHNYGVGGRSTRTYISDGSINNVLSATADEFYTFCFGINDLEQLGIDYIGSITDINDTDYTQNADTFYGNYGKIIQMIKEYAPNSKMVLIGVYKPDTSSKKYSLFSAETEKIAEHFGIPYINPFDDDYFSSDFFKNDIVKGHPTRMGYVGAGIAFERLFSECIKNNAEYFKYLD